jgi:hypothetical protein
MASPEAPFAPESATLDQLIGERRLPADYPQRQGAEAGLAEFAEKARTAEGRKGLMDDVNSNKVAGLVTQGDAVLEKAARSPDANDETLRDYGKISAESRTLLSIEDPQDRRALTDYARETAKQNGKPFEEPGKDELWNSNENLREVRYYGTQAQRERELTGTSIQDLDIGGAPNKTPEDVSKMIDGIDRDLGRERDHAKPAIAKDGGREL